MQLALSFSLLALLLCQRFVILRYAFVLPLRRRHHYRIMLLRYYHRLLIDEHESDIR